MLVKLSYQELKDGGPNLKKNSLVGNAIFHFIKGFTLVVACCMSFISLVLRECFNHQRNFFTGGFSLLAACLFKAAAPMETQRFFVAGPDIDLARK